MNTLFTSSNVDFAPAEAAETSLGWTSMPTYGEILPTLVGESHTLPRNFLSLGKSAATAPAQTFWSMVANAK